MFFDSFLNSHKEKNYHFFKLDLISLIYNSDDAKMGHHINLILLNKGDIK